MRSRCICVSLAVAANCSLLFIAASENLGFRFALDWPLLPSSERFWLDDEDVPNHPSRVPFERLIVEDSRLLSLMKEMIMEMLHQQYWQVSFSYTCDAVLGVSVMVEKRG
jgi:hypothetical protein